jgi:electron transfer flavoprotein beta subunit
VWCGDASLDRGSGAVPAYLAAHLGAAQALGLVTVDIDTDSLTALRRLDGGRRERLRVRAPAVCSVEGSTARLRRAPLPARLAASGGAIEVHAGPPVSVVAPHGIGPYRPRARALPTPAGTTALARITALIGAPAPAVHGQPVPLDPPAAADEILEMLRKWSDVDG